MKMPTGSSWRTRAITGLAAAGLAAAGLAVAAAPANAVSNARLGSGINTLAGLYEDAGFGGANLLIFSNNSGCTGPIDDLPDFQSPGMPGGWNDELSSFQGFSGSLGPCWVKIYKDVNFGTPMLGYTSESLYVGDAANDETTAFQVS